MTGGQGGGIRGWLRGLLPDGAATDTSLPDLSLPAGNGPLVWMRVGAGYEQSGPDPDTLAPALIQLLVQMRRCGLQIAVSRGDGIAPDLSTRGVSGIPDAADDHSRAAAHLQVMDPDALLLIGSELPPRLIEAAHAEDIPVILAEARLSAPRRTFRRPLLPRDSLLPRLDLLLLPDAASRDAALEIGADPARVVLTGPITQTREPLHHNEAERAALAEAFQGRQLWLAVCVTEAEEDAVIQAHLTVLRYSHRALLIVLPDDAARASAMAGRMGDAGLVVAQRSMDEDPTDEVSVYLSDDTYELGLWYRLSPLCFMGTTLAGSTDSARDPFEAASLGSAAIHGPQHGDFSAEWAQLDGAAAARPVPDATGLTQAVITLLAPDQAARLATNAWAVSTGGAGVASRIARAVRDVAMGEAP